MDKNIKQLKEAAEEFKMAIAAGDSEKLNQVTNEFYTSLPNFDLADSDTAKIIDEIAELIKYYLRNNPIKSTV